MLEIPDVVREKALAVGAGAWLVNLHPVAREMLDAAERLASAG